jgi:hypothetical protein
MLKRLLLFALLILIVSPAAWAMPYCCAGKCAGHNYTDGGNNAWVETINTATTSVGSSETSIASACLENGSTRKELRSAVAFNALLRAYIRIDCLNNVPAGGRYGIRFYVDDVEVGGTMRFFRMHPGTSTSALLPQGDTFGAVALNLAAGQHKLEVKAYMVDGGTMTIGNAWITAEGSPLNYVTGQSANLSAGRTVLSTAATITDQWAPITGTLRLTNNTASNVDVYPLAQFQFQGGTPDDKISVGFAFKHATDSTYPASDRTSDFEVPCPLKSGGACYWPTTDTARDAINIFDHKFSLAPGDWDVTLYAIDRNAGHTATAAFRELEFVYFPSNGTANDTIGTSSTVVDSTTGVSAGIVGDSCPSLWTKIAEVTIPAHATAMSDLGEGYIEFLGRGSDGLGTNAGDWTNPDVELLVTLEGPGISNPLEWGARIVSLPSGYHGLYFVLESAPVTLPGPGSYTYKVWLRKRGSSCAFTVCANRGTAGATKFLVGKRYFSVRNVNNNASCNEYDLSYNGQPGNCPLQ